MFSGTCSSSEFKRFSSWNKVWYCGQGNLLPHSVVKRFSPIIFLLVLWYYFLRYFCLTKSLLFINMLYSMPWFLTDWAQEGIPFIFWSSRSWFHWGGWDFGWYMGNSLRQWSCVATNFWFCTGLLVVLWKMVYLITVAVTFTSAVLCFCYS